MTDEPAQPEAAADRPLVRLLAVQASDTKADQLRHRLATLPERSALAEAASAAEAVGARVHDVDEQRSELERIQKRHEDEIASVEAKIADVDRKLYSGSVSVPKELKALQDEITSLKRYQSGLEDRVLSAMEELEPVVSDLAELRSEADRLEEAIAKTSAGLTAAETEIERELAEVEAERADATDGVPPAALAAYERLRGQMGGVAIARLEKGTCQGCYLRLSAVEFDRIKKEPTDAVVHCEECGRMLVY